MCEFKPRPAMREELIDPNPSLADKDRVFALHAKNLVIDDRVFYIGTFNLDPRSANLNTEVGVLAENEELARQLGAGIERDIKPENSRRSTVEFNPDNEIGRGKRLRVWFTRLLPIGPVL